MDVGSETLRLSRSVDSSLDGDGFTKNCYKFVLATAAGGWS